MKYIYLFLALSSLNYCLAQEKTFEREYTYKASELDSKISCRAIVINQLRTTLLNELGVYVESEQILKTTDVGGKFSQDFVENIATISAGITKLNILDEKWNGETFWMKASITVDKKSLEESLKQLIADRQKVNELEEVNEKLRDATKEINRLKKALRNSRTNEKTQTVYNEEVNSLVATDYYYKANSKLELEDYQGAIDDYNKAIELSPNDAVVYFNRGLAKDFLHDYHGAIRDYNKAIELDPNFVNAYLAKANIKNSLSDFHETIADLTKAIELDPSYSVLYTTRGYAKGSLKDDRGAKADFTKAIELNPKDAYAYLWRGISSIHLGDKESACLDFSKAGELGNHEAYEKIKQYCQ